MEFAIEILQQTTTAWSRWLVFLAVLLIFCGIRFYKTWKKQRDELGNMKKLQLALQIKKLVLEIELMELGIRAHAADLIKIPRIPSKEENEIRPESSSPPVLWSDKMIYGLLGSFFFC